MNSVTVLLIQHNAAEYTKMSLQSIRLFADVEALSVVLVDNHSDSPLNEWAREQEDITYIYMDEGQLPYGQVVNAVCQQLQIVDDILIMDSHYMLTPHALSRMQTLLYQKDTIGAVGCVANSFPFGQRMKEPEDYEAAVRWADRNQMVAKEERALGLYPDIVLIKAAVISQLGTFDDELMDQEYVIRDYSLRMVLNDWELHVCRTALFWDIRGNGPYHSASKAQAAVLERKWGMHYFNYACNANIIDLIARNREEPINVLEIGCDCGATLLGIHNRFPHATVCGCEINEKAAMIASHIAEVQIGNIEEYNLQFSPHFFDYILFGDVLEHLHDPLKVIQYSRNFLKPEGCIIASIPNLMHISVVEGLLQGNFTYTETGLLDKTHIHFFTYYEIIRLFEAGGFAIETIRSLVVQLTSDNQILIDKLMEIQSNTPRFMYEAFQYLVCARISA